MHTADSVFVEFADDCIRPGRHSSVLPNILCGIEQGSQTPQIIIRWLRGVKSQLLGLWFHGCVWRYLLFTAVEGERLHKTNTRRAHPSKFLAMVVDGGPTTTLASSDVRLETQTQNFWLVKLQEEWSNTFACFVLPAWCTGNFQSEACTLSPSYGDAEHFPQFFCLESFAWHGWIQPTNTFGQGISSSIVAQSCAVTAFMSVLRLCAWRPWSLLIPKCRKKWHEFLPTWYENPSGQRPRDDCRMPSTLQLGCHRLHWFHL